MPRGVKKKRASRVVSLSRYDYATQWVLLIGILVVLISSAIGYATPFITGFLVLFGLLIGFSTIKHENELLLGGLSFLFLIFISKAVYVIPLVGSFVDRTASLLAPIILVVALKKVYRILRR